MDAGLAWTIVGSAAAVVAIPTGLVIGILQLRQGRKTGETPPPADPLLADRDQIAGLQKERHPSGFVVALLSPEGSPAGMGFLAGVSEILTCAHVVNRALGRSLTAQNRPENLVTVSFPLLRVSGSSPVTVSARVEKWIAPPLEGVAEGNVAVLRLADGPTPEGVAPAVLATDAPQANQAVEVFGYPTEPPRPDGGWAQARIRGFVAGGRLQLDTSTGAALRIQPGYLGSPVCDRGSGYVVGMLAVASHSGAERDAYAIGVEELISVRADELDLAIAESSPVSVRPVAAVHGTQDDVCAVAPDTASGSQSVAEKDDGIHPRSDGFPVELSERQAVLAAYAGEIDMVASYLQEGMSVMLGSEKLLMEHLAPEIASRSGRVAWFVGPSLASVGETDLVGTGGGRRADIIAAFQQTMAKAGPDDLIVMPSFDLLVGRSDEMASGEAIEVADLYERSDRVILAFTDMSKIIPEPLANRFDIRVAIDILPRSVQARDGRVVPVGRALVTEAEASLFAGFDAVKLYGHIAGMNAVRLRRGMRFAYHQTAVNGPLQPTFASLLNELRMFKARNSSSFEIPRASLQAIGGYRDVKDEIYSELQLITGAAASDNNLSARLVHELIPRGFIFHGPRGAGKTLFAGAIADELGALIRIIPCSEFLRHQAIVESKIRNLFAEARRNAPAVLVFDDIDLIAARNGNPPKNDEWVTNAFISLLLAELDGLRPETPVVVIATTNRLNVLDDRLLTWRPLKLIKIGLPETSDRREIAIFHARHFEIAASDELLDAVARSTEGMTGADLHSIFRDARAGKLLDSHGHADTIRVMELIRMRRDSRQ
jgi:transitional endoplasmic reticulum ATPase